MSYERPGFDPTSANANEFQVHHNTFHHIGVYVVEFGTLLKRAETATVTLVDTEMDAKSDASHLKATLQSGKNYNGSPAYLYSGNVALRPTRSKTNNFEHFMDTVEFDNLTVDSFTYSNVRLITDKSNTFDADVSYYSDEITVNNQITHNDQVDRRQRRLIAPARGTFKDGGQYEHFMSSLIAATHVANNVHHSRLRPLALGPLVLTPDGPLYHNPDTGEYVHRLGRESITVTVPEKKSQVKEKKEGLDSLFGIDDIKEELKPIILYYKNPKLAEKWKTVRPGGIFLFGPGGTGKTTIINALAADMQADVYEVKGSELYGKYMGESQQRIADVFNKVRDVKKPTFLFFDEFEGLISTTDSTSSGSATINAVAGIFKTETARILKENPNVILAAATNYPDRIDPVLIRAGRFDLKIPVHLPNQVARQQVFGQLILNAIGNEHIEPDDIELDATVDSAASKSFTPYRSDVMDLDALSELAQLTEGFSIADIINVLRAATLQKALEEVDGQQVTPVSLDDLKTKIMKHRQSQT